MSKRKDDTVTRYLARRWAEKFKIISQVVSPEIEKFEKQNDFSFGEESVRAFIITCMIDSQRASGFNLYNAMLDEAARVSGSYEKRDINKCIEDVANSLGLSQASVSEKDTARYMVLEQLTQMDSG